MKLFSWWRKPEVKTQQFEQVLMQIIAARDGVVGTMVTPDTALASPTVQAIDTAISRRLSVTPVHVYQRGQTDGHETKKKLPDHPVAQLLRKPNEWQTASDFWMDAASVWTRHGNFYAYKSQTGSGKTVALIPLPPPTVEPKLEDNKRFHYVVDEGGQKVEYAQDKILHARQRGKNFYVGDSPVKEIQTAIMMEILAEKFGESFLDRKSVV